ILKGDVLDAVGAEYRKLANVLIELPYIPGVPRIGAIAVTELVAANRIGRRHDDPGCCVEHRRALRQIHRSQQLADPEKYTTRIGPHDPDDCPPGSRDVGGNYEAFSLQLRHALLDLVRRVLSAGNAIKARSCDDDRT